MKDYYSIQERNDLENHIFDLVQEYLETKNCYLDGIGLSINRETLELNLCTREECQEEEDWCSIEDLLYLENGNQMPSCDTIYEIASSYCFIE